LILPLNYPIVTDGSSILFAGLSLALILGLLWVLLRIKPLAGIFPPESARISSLDGLRGFLAFAVVFSHLLSYRIYLQTGKWDFPDHFFKFAPVVGVQLFFCITGFLFWTKAIRSGGRFNVPSFYRRRFLRIYPLYLAVALVTAAVCLVTPSSDPSGVHNFASAIWILVPHEWPEIHGNASFYYLAQSWTLAFELIFYFLLPLLALAFAKSAKSFALLSLLFLAFLVICMKVSALAQLAQCAPFLVGMITAEVRERAKLEQFFLGAWGAAISLGGFVVLYVAHSKFSDVFLLACFMPVAHGNTLFGLLSWRPCRALGDISYSVYMVHLVIIGLAIRALAMTVQPWALPNYQYWLFGFACCLVIVAVSLATYRVFEQPFIRPESGSGLGPRAL